jgi:hypothetical protein
MSIEPVRRKNESGFVLITVLIILAVLMAAGIGASVSVQNNLRVSASMRAGTIAAYLAEAGVEVIKQRIAKAAAIPVVSPATTGELAGGHYSVSILSSTQTGPLSAVVLVRALGQVGKATQSVHARITKTYDLADAAITLRGRARGFNFAGDMFSLSGLDEDLVSRTPIYGARTRAAITVASAEALQQLENALETQQRAKLVGDDGLGYSIAIGRSLAATDIDRLAMELCSAPNVISVDVPPTGSLLVTGEIWGNRVAPELRCVRGAPGAGDTVAITGNTSGAGVLVVRDTELVISGAFQWEGWIIVSGSDVGFRVAGADEKTILGALVLAESGQAVGSGPLLLDISGSVRIGFSRQAFTIAASAVPDVFLASSYAVLPAVIKQDYWRSISP